MRILITGGHTEVPIDKVRSITNIFKGKTGYDLAQHFLDKKNYIHLISNKNITEKLMDNEIYWHLDYVCSSYRTYDELYTIMEQSIKTERYDVIIHSAAVSDYKVDGVVGGNLVQIDNSAKISSDHDVLYLKLVKTEKIIDKIREWGFKGTLVKFKLQVGISDEELIEIAEKSRVASGADIIVANCLEWAKDRAIILADGINKPVCRNWLPRELEKVIKKVRK